MGVAGAGAPAWNEPGLAFSGFMYGDISVSSILRCLFIGKFSFQTVRIGSDSLWLNGTGTGSSTAECLSHHTHEKKIIANPLLGAWEELGSAR